MAVFKSRVARLLLLTAATITFSSQHALAAAQTGSAQTNLSRLKKTRTQLKKQILLLARERTCALNRDCAYLAVGAKSCGGPEFYVIYSKRAHMGNALKRKTSSYNNISREIPPAAAAAAACKVLFPPEVKCESHVCRDSSS